jgi:hypothetical protein
MPGGNRTAGFAGSAANVAAAMNAGNETVAIPEFYGQ